MIKVSWELPDGSSIEENRRRSRPIQDAIYAEMRRIALSPLHLLNVLKARQRLLEGVDSIKTLVITDFRAAHMDRTALAEFDSIPVHNCNARMYTMRSDDDVRRMLKLIEDGKDAYRKAKEEASKETSTLEPLGIQTLGEAADADR